MSSNFSEEVARRIEEINKAIVEFLSKHPELMKESEIFDLCSKGSSLVKRLEDAKDKISEFVKISQDLRIKPDELIEFLLLPDIPVRIGVGKKFVESIIGFRGLGIETIDHHLDKFSYEGISDESEEVSITTIMYRVPPYMFVSPDSPPDLDKRISDIVGNRFIWLVRPRGLKKEDWFKVSGKPIADGDAQFVNGMYVPSRITLIDLINKCIKIETPWVSLKFGCERIKETVGSLANKNTILSKLIELKESGDANAIGGWGLRFDYVYYCYWGKGLSTDPFDIKCPFTNCEVRKRGICNGIRLWSGTYGSRKPFPKVYPLRDAQFQNDGVKIYEENLPDGIIKFSAYDYRHVHNYWYGVEFGTWFIRTRPTIRLFFGDEKHYFKIGYRIPTSVIEVTLDDNWLERAILDSLKYNEALRKSLALKFILYGALGRTFEYERLVRKIDELLNKEGDFALYQRIVGEKRFERDFMVFCKRVLLHSLKHFFSQFILRNLLGVEFNFVIPKYYYNSGQYPNNVNRILIAENAKNGKIGIVDTIVKIIDDKGLPQFLREFCEFTIRYLEEHTREFNKIDAERQKEAKKCLDRVKSKLNEDKMKRLESIENAVKSLKERSENVGIELDSATARLYLLIEGGIDETVLRDIEDYFDDVLDSYGFHTCVDGCNACVRLEKECGEGSGQILTTSKLLLLEVLKRLKHLLEHGFSFSNERNVGRIVEPILQGAKRELLISSPFISDHYVKTLIEEKVDKGVDVKIITAPSAEGDENITHQRALEELKRLEEKYENLEIKIVDDLHAKLYIVDRRYAITGSANLTVRGMKYNIEHVEIKMDERSISEFIESFERLWSSTEQAIRT